MTTVATKEPAPDDRLSDKPWHRPLSEEERRRARRYFYVHDATVYLFIAALASGTAMIQELEAALSRRVVDGQLDINYWLTFAIISVGSPIIFFAYHRYTFDRNVRHVFVPINYGEPEELVLSNISSSIRRMTVTLYMERLKCGGRASFTVNRGYKHLYKLGERFVGLVHPEDPSVIIMPGPKSLKLCSDVARETFVHQLISTYANARLKPSSWELGG